MSRTLESDIQRDIIAYLTMAGYWPLRFYMGAIKQAGGRRAKNPNRGFPDILVWDKERTGKVFAIEVKKPGGRLSVDQADMIHQLEGRGTRCLVATSVDEVREWLSISS